MKGSSKYMIFFAIALMVSAILVFDRTLTLSQSEAIVIAEPNRVDEFVPAEEDVFKQIEMAMEFHNMKTIESKKSLSDYHKNRAYDGAPPIIPHVVLSEEGIGGASCLQCHEKGGYVAQFEAFAPMTPHPQYLNCKQCHVPAKTDKLFKSSSFTRSAPPTTGNTALMGSPPIIPHSLQLRNNCLSCHGGPSAPKEIRVSHPERVNCRQCHAAASPVQEWQRKTPENLKEASNEK